MITSAHTNIITDDWKLADFYMKVFHCKPLLPEKDLKSDRLDKPLLLSITRNCYHRKNYFVYANDVDDSKLEMMKRQET